MASRAYRRDNRGRFAGANGGTKVTYGKAGGFANAAHRARVQQGRKVSKSRKIGRGAANLVLGKKGTRERKQTITGLAAMAGGSLMIHQGVKRGNETLLIAGIASSLGGNVAVRTSTLGGKPTKSRARARQATGARVRR